MNEFTYINLFYNMVYFNEQAYMRSFNVDYSELSAFRRWLDDHGIRNMPSLDAISSYSLGLLHEKLTYKEMETLLHVDLQRDLDLLADTYATCLHVIFIPGVDASWPSFQLDDPTIMFFQLPAFTKDELTFSDPFPAFMEALTHADEWPGALIFTKDHSIFVPVTSVANLNAYLARDDVFAARDDQASYYFHISDLHLHSQKKLRILEQLYDSIDHVLSFTHSTHRPKFLISGDLMNSPSRTNMYQATGFMTTLKKRYRGNVCFVLGNHDMIIHGLSVHGQQKSKVVAYLLEDKLEIYDDDHVIIIKIDSNFMGHLARGSIGERQLRQIDEELEAIWHLEDYTMLAMLHHHVVPITKAPFLKKQWNEGKILGRIADETKALIDADAFIYWLHNHNVRYVVHGHKHIPYFEYHDASDSYMISAGSATGSLKEANSRYMSYNVLKYQYQRKRMSQCLIIYEDKKDAHRKRIELYLFDHEEE